ncbi:DUF7033 domain-containing protein [Gracilimonas sp.]|uniref:DUF7033 domain-containing protein n=1 Tax=Gracilimonas sp. TaxID=1974203 RepID=UPI002872A404|nr:hypothetical protein [Gracilimonas sp.]
MNPDHISAYFLETFFQFYETDRKISIGYEDSSNADIIIFQGNLSFFKETKAIPKYFIWHSWKDKDIPFLFDQEEKQDVITVEKENVRINYDIIASVFYFLSHWQEIHQTETDKYGRFPYQNSIQYHYDFALLPVVNYYFDILKAAIEKTGVNIQRKQQIAPIQVFLSHDIDNLSSGWLENIFAELKRGNLLKTYSILKNKWKGKDPWDNLDDILELEKQLGVVSTYFFLPREGNGNADYKLEKATPWFDHIRQANSEVGLHGSLNSAFDDAQFQADLDEFSQPIVGNRFHFLKFSANTTPHILDQTDILYDASHGFAEHIGFRSGFCYPYQPFNFSTNRAHKHWQIPLLLMDTTLRNPSYMGKEPANSIETKIDTLIEEIALFDGVLSILWHNTYFSESKFAGWHERYVSLIKKLKNKGAAFYTGEEIIEWIHE